MNIKSFFAFLLVIVMLCSSLPIMAAADGDICTVTFTDGLNLINPLTGKSPTDIFTGTPVPSITVKVGESFVLPENTIVFRDYIFAGWKYRYTDKNGEKKVKIYQPGDTFENVTENIEFGASWKRPVPIDLVITGYLKFVSTESYVDGEIPEPMQVVYNSTITLKKVALTKDGYKFCGWVDSDGNFYENGGKYTVNKLNPVLTAIWEADGTAVLTHKVIYKGGADDISGELPRTLEMYKKNTFTAAECNVTRNGWRFVCWTDDNGKEYLPGKEYQAEGDILNLTAKWEKIIKYYTVTITHNEGGSVTPDSPIQVEEHDNIQISSIPDVGYYVSSLTINGEEQSLENVSNFSIDDVTRDIAVVVTFAKISLPDISLTSSGEGEIKREAAPEGQYAFSVHPAAGYKINSITVTGASYTISGEIYLLENFTGEPIKVYAEFIPNTSSEETSSQPTTAPGENEDVFYLILLGVLVVGLIAFAVIYTKRRR